jgi:hypothetical protein
MRFLLTNYYNKLIIVFISLSCSCQISSSDFDYRFQTIEIPIESDFNLTYSKYLISDSSLVGFNKQLNSIQELYFNSTSKENSELISFTEEGPDSFITPSLFTYYSGKIYAVDTYLNIQSINSNIKSLNKKQLFLTKNEVDLGLYNGYSVNPPQAHSLYSQKLIFPVYKLIPRSTPNYYDSLHFVELDLNTFKYEINSFKLPVEFSNNNWPVHDAFSVAKINENKYVISFEAIADIFIGIKNGDLARSKVDLEVFKLGNSVESFKTKENQIMVYRNRKYAYGSQKFFPLKYNKNNNSFYRVIKGKTDGENIHPYENLHLFKWDSNFNLLNHVPLQTGLLADFTINNGVIYFQQSEKFAKSEDFMTITKLVNF